MPLPHAHVSVHLLTFALIPKILFAHPPNLLPWLYAKLEMKTLHLEIQLTTVQGTGQVRWSHSLSWLLLVIPEASADWVPIERRPWTPGGKAGATPSVPVPEPFIQLKAAQLQESCFTPSFPKAQNKEENCASGSSQTKSIYTSADREQRERKVQEA